jgi:hypothetical protein
MSNQLLRMISKGILVSCGFAHARGIGSHAWNFTLWMIRSFELQFSMGCVTVLTIVSPIRCVRPAKMGTELVGTLMHANALQRGNAPHSASHPAYVYHALQYTYEIILCGSNACGPIPRAWANPHDTKNALNGRQTMEGRDCCDNIQTVFIYSNYCTIRSSKLRFIQRLSGLVTGTEQENCTSLCLPWMS